MLRNFDLAAGEAKGGLKSFPPLGVNQWLLVGSGCGGQPLVEAAIRRTVGDTYTELGEYAAAQAHLERALALYRRELGDDHPDTLTALSSLGTLHLHRDEFLPRYHQRSNIESTFSMIKRVFGGSVRSRTKTAQVNEVLLKILAHNLRVLVHEMHELGIAPAFAPCGLMEGAIKQ